jgi:hypothetical protein
MLYGEVSVNLHCKIDKKFDFRYGFCEVAFAVLSWLND